MLIDNPCINCAKFSRYIDENTEDIHSIIPELCDHYLCGSDKCPNKNDVKIFIVAKDVAWLLQKNAMTNQVICVDVTLDKIASDINDLNMLKDHINQINIDETEVNCNDGYCYTDETTFN